MAARKSGIMRLPVALKKAELTPTADLSEVRT